MWSEALLERGALGEPDEQIICIPGPGPIDLALFIPAPAAQSRDAQLTSVELDRLSDEELLAACAQQQEGAFPLLQERLRPYVRNMLRKMLHADDHVDDLTQEVFLRLYRAAASFDPARPLRKWLVTIMLNEVRRFTSRQKTVVSLSTSLHDSDESLELGSVLTDNRPTPEVFTERALLFQHLRHLLDRLPAVQRDAMVMRYLHDLSLEEIAARLDCPLATVSSRLHYAAAKLRNWLGKSFAARL